MPRSNRPPSRRAVLTAAGGTVAAYALSNALIPGHAAAAADAFDDLRSTWRGLVLGTGFSPTAEPFKTRLTTLGAQGRAWRDAMDPVPGSLWPDRVYTYPAGGADASTRSAAMDSSFGRLRTMAVAYAQPGTGHQGDTGMRDAVLTGLKHLHKEVYNADQARYGNWWHWQIGGPQQMLDALVLVHDGVPADLRSGLLGAVDHFVPDSSVASYTGVSTGANRVDLCRVLALRGMLGRSSQKLTLARDKLTPVFPYVTSGDGFYHDGSFIQHSKVPYTGTYGAVLLGGLASMFTLFTGSTWEVTDSGRQNIFDAVEDSFAPFLYNGLVMDGVSGRAISRGLTEGDPSGVQQDDHRRGHSILGSIVLLGESAGAAERERWRGLVKGWIRRDYYSPVLEDAKLSVPDLARLVAVRDDAGVEVPAEPAEHRLFPVMDRATHRRPGWAASLSMASKRTTYYETGNGENPRGWHTGNGMLYWWGSDFGNGQYSDAFWPTVDAYRLPGTTVSRKPLADGAGGAWANPTPDVNWVGGATDGRHATVGQYVKGLSSTLMGKKAWFFLDDTIVCLGAGIKCTDGYHVESIVDNRNLGATGHHLLTVDGVAQPTQYPWKSTLSGASWAHLGGFGGYVFLGGADVHALREERAGAWQDISPNGSDDVLRRRYLTLWIDHGYNPFDLGYAYLVLPGAGQTQTGQRAAATTWAKVLANSDRVQAVRVDSAGFTGAAFWFGDTAGPLTASAPCAVMIRERPDGTALVCVSDPMRMQEELTLTWQRPVTQVISHPSTVTSAETGSALKLVFGDLRGTAGATQRITVRLG